IRVPAFAEFRPGEKPVRPSELRFPLIVKPLLEDASVGIAQASVVEDDEDLGARVKFIHEKFHQAAIVEELIEGRELYVWLHGYGRVGLRLTHDDAVYVLEVTPNPFLAQENEMADAAEKAGMSYNAFIQRIVDEALARGTA